METKEKKQVTEAFNTIRTNLEFLKVDRDLQIIMVISSVKGEGKTTIVANLANALTADNKKVLIIDADFRNPSIHRMLLLPNRRGLSDLICENSEQPGSCIQNYNKKIDLLTAGHKPPNPSELLGSTRMKFILDKLRESYDIILIDTPPILIFPDTLALSKYVDGEIMVTRFGYTTTDILDSTYKTLELANMKPVACIFNAVEGIKKRYPYYGYYAYEDKASTKQAEKINVPRSGAEVVNIVQARRKT